MKMRLLFVVLLLFVFGQFTYGQLSPLTYDTIKRAHEFNWNSSVDYNSSSINRTLSSKFIRGGFIDETIKNDVSSKQKDMNRMGAFYGSEFEYRNYNLNLFKDWGSLVKFEYGSLSGVNYTNDLFDLVFFGNDPFKGRKMDFSGTNLLSTTYQKIGFGIVKAKSKSSISLNFYNVSNRTYSNFQEVSFLQNTGNDEVDMTLKGEFSTKNNNKFSQGVGIGIDVDFILPFNLKKDKSIYVQFQAKNIGLLYMHRGQNYYEVDTTILFSGLEFSDLIGDDALFSDSTNSILNQLGVQSTSRKQVKLLPGYFQVAKIVNEMSLQKVQSYFGVRLYPSLLFLPQGFLGIDYKPFKSIHFGANVSYGGFGGFRAGLYTSVKIKTLSIGLSSENILGFITKKSYGQSLNLRLKCAF